MCEVDVAHQPEHQSEAAGDQEIKPRERDPIEDRADERLLALQRVAEPRRPQAEDHPQQHGGGEQGDTGPNLSRRRSLCGPCCNQTHAISLRRCSFMRGALWNLPSFMIASSRVLSCSMRMLAT